MIPVVVVLIAIMAFTSFFYKSHNGTPPRQSSTAIQRAATSEKVKLEKASNRDIIHDPVGGVQQVVVEKEASISPASERIKLEAPVNEMSSTIQTKKSSASSQESRESRSKPTQERKKILSSCGRRSSKEA